MKRHISLKQLGIVVAFFSLVLLFSACQPATPIPTPTATPSVTPSPDPSPSPSFPPPPVIKTNADDEFGVNWGNSPYTNPPHPISSSDRTNKAKEAGATWDRWPVYWYWVNQPVRWGEGRENFHWAGDFPLTGEVFNIGEAASTDGNELKTLAILDGIPRFYDCAWEEAWSPDHPDGSGCYGTAENRITGDRIEGLSLEPEDGNPINEANRWAAYVYETVAHLSQNGIDHFEIWNEPDLGNRWNKPNDPDTENAWEPAWSYVNDYANMVHATTAAAQQANSNAQLILGAPTSNDEIFIPGDPANPKPTDGWIGNAWRLVQSQDLHTPLHAIAIHSYGWSFFTPLIAIRATDLIDKPIWITESGLAVNNCEEGHICANDENQVANYLLQQYAYARVVGAEIIVHHRLQDDDDYHFGLYSNSGVRPAVKAAQLATRYLQGAKFLKDASSVPEFTRDGFAAFNSPFVKLVFEQLNARVTVLWAHGINSVPAGQVEIQPWGSSAWIINSQGETEGYRCGLTSKDVISVPELKGAPNTLLLPNDSNNPSVVAGMPAIGGPVYILVETNESCTASAPTGAASLVCANGRVVGTALLGYDESAGLATLIAACSPGVIYDLSWTQPGPCRVVLIIVLYISPPVVFPAA